MQWLLSPSWAPQATSVPTRENAPNPFLEAYDTPYEIPPFDKITNDDYMPALREGIRLHNEEIKAIAENPDTPTFDNTILALDNSGEVLGKVIYVFGALTESNSSDELQAISEEFMPLFSQHEDEVMMNGKLFERIKHVYDHRNELGLAPDQLRLVDETYKNFVRNGALLSEDKKKELSDINTKLSGLYLKFNKNLLEATKLVRCSGRQQRRTLGPAGLKHCSGS